MATRNVKSTLSVDFQFNRRPFALSSAKGYTQSENREFVDQRPEKSVRPDNPFPFGLVSALVEITERRNWCAELHRLRGVFLATMGADEAQIETSFSAAIRIAIEQKSISLAKRAEASYAEYRQKRSALRGRFSEEL